MGRYNEVCSECSTNLIVDDGDCYPGGLKDDERIFCPVCKNELRSVYTSGCPHVYIDKSIQTV